MATEFSGIVYFPTQSAFFEGAIPETLEAKHGIKGPYLLIKMLCKIYKEGYYIPWDDEQCEIFAYKLGREYSKDEVKEIIDTLLDKDFLDRKCYEEYHILTSKEIQRVWIEATSRRKRNLTKLPYLFTDFKCKQPEGTNPKKVDNSSPKTNPDLKSEDIFKQSRVENIREEEKEEESKKKEDDFILPPPPEYALNKTTHNYEGMLLTLEQLRITDTADKKAIIKMSNYGEKGHHFWQIVSKTPWSKISMPGKYLIKSLKNN